jgi:hypothetical protein
MTEPKTITLYLTGWQKRMIKDHMSAPDLKITSANKLIVSNIPKKEWVMYRVAISEHAKVGQWNLYLTDEQISHVVEIMGVDAKISALTISPEMVKSGAITFE